MQLLVRNGTVVSPHGRVLADVLCANGRVAGLYEPGQAPAADDVLDADGLLVFPGFIDPHVHSRDPGNTHKEDFAHSTLGALAGGVTTILEMPNAIPPVTDVRTFEERAAHHESQAHVDFGLWALSLGAANLDAVPGLFEAGAVAVKLFWGYALDRQTKQLVYQVDNRDPDSIVMPPDNGEVFELFAEVARVGGLLAAHCEDRDVIAASQRRLGRAIGNYDDLLAVRPDTAEAASIALATEFVRTTGCRFHVVHLASAKGLALVAGARREGLPLSAETCPHYLLLTDDAYAQVGPAMKVFPPVRRAEDQQALWQGLRDGTIISVGSDHAPHTVEEKQLDLAEQPAGTIGVETLAPLLLDQMASGRISPERLAYVLSESTARLYGLYPRKGAVLPGSDADLTVVDPTATRTIRNEDLHAKHPFSVWDGRNVTGLPVASVLRGVLAMRDGRAVQQPRGRLVRAQHQAVGPQDSGLLSSP